ncbi:MULTISPECIES: tRNA-uridine aminocarboxypropyltransferase [unclassified Duganella]|uniref:tRNA-uridine aminocarboxypropyltransferase n=1 Tax=unclassified Duganella TaxID=2636909 RepID=UPI000E34F79E|nr:MULTISPECIES: tRNA-uridine aminocarboxypropyltransferase [unclassified Duganella]RFP18371.1 DTW domain-containing protein [Duganella sp. BJB475]RFP35037.1 DTW domain-containing protein [Duganella sp. BJB476]
MTTSTDGAAAPSIPRSTRALCATCLRPQQTCICRWVAALPNQVEVLILQHPMEVNNAKGSARLLHLSLAASRLEVGEAFAPERLQTLMSPARRSVLLYPDTAADKSLGLAAAQPFDVDWLREPQLLRLVVLDGTWRKSRKMLYLNPALQALPRLPLRDTPPSHYLIRKAHLPDQLSTLEATVYALAQLENDINKFNPLIDAFDGFVAQQAGYVARPPSGDQL